MVVPYFLFAGRLIERLGAEVEAFRARYPWFGDWGRDTMIAL
ncbi:hypothetical protein L0152_11500 [bacterium]|nr:hypothetical protein [bacterium]